MSLAVTPRSEDYSRWYTDVVQKAELADYSPVKGCMVIRPNGYAIWENIQKVLDRMIKETGARNAYFPLFIPESFLHKEAEHVEGFAPECAVVTHGGGKKLEEPMVIRPTSETIIYAMFAKWIMSYRDLPLLINQWANVVRWEMRTRLFLRTTEFLWQEGHTAHETEAEAEEEALKMLGIYRTLVEESLAIPVLRGRKTDSERFAGALRTYAIEALMQDKKALQAGTSHNLGQNFAKAFGVQYQDREGKMQHVWQTSWGVSTRLVGAVVMAHGDDKGLVLPPRIAPTQAVVVPIYSSDADRARVAEFAAGVEAALGGRVRHEIDWRDQYKPGWKYADWEQKGVPLRIEIGPRDVEKGHVMLARRDGGAKQAMPLAALADGVPALLEEIQASLFKRALDFREANTSDVEDRERFEQILGTEGGFVRARWCGGAECEASVKERTKATIRVIPLDAPDDPGPCAACGARSAGPRVIWARAY